MSVKLMGQVWECDLAPSEQSLLLALADHAQDDGTRVYPSIAHTAWKLGCSVSSVKRAVRALKSRGILHVRQSGGGRFATEYNIDLSAVPRKKPFKKDTRAKLTPVKAMTPQQGQIDPPAGSRVTPQSSLKQSYNRPKKPDPFTEGYRRPRNTDGPRSAAALLAKR